MTERTTVKRRTLSCSMALDSAIRRRTPLATATEAVERMVERYVAACENQQDDMTWPLTEQELYYLALRFYNVEGLPMPRLLSMEEIRNMRRELRAKSPIRVKGVDHEMLRAKIARFRLSEMIVVAECIENLWLQMNEPRIKSA